MVFMVMFEFRGAPAPPELRDATVAAIKGCGPWARLSESTWLLRTEQDLTSVREAIWRVMRPGDFIFVARLEGSWGAYNLSQRIVEWVQGSTF